MMKDRRTVLAQAQPDEDFEALIEQLEDQDREDDFDYDESVAGGQGRTRFTRRESTPEELQQFGERPFIRLHWGPSPADPDETVVVGFDMPIVFAHPTTPRELRSMSPSQVVSAEIPQSPAYQQHWLEAFAGIPEGTPMLYNLPPLTGRRTSGGGRWWSEIIRGLKDRQTKQHWMMHPRLLPEDYLARPTDQQYSDLYEFQPEIKLSDPDDPRVAELVNNENLRRRLEQQVDEAKKKSTWGERNLTNKKAFEIFFRDIIRKLQAGEDVDIFATPIVPYKGGTRGPYQVKRRGSGVKTDYNLFNWAEEIAMLAAQGIIGNRYEAEVFVEDMDLMDIIGDALQKVLNAYRDPSLGHPMSAYFQDAVENAVIKAYLGRFKDKFRGYDDVAGVGKEGDRQSGEEAIEGGESITSDTPNMTPDEVILNRDAELREANIQLRKTLGFKNLDVKEIMKRSDNYRAKMVAKINVVDPNLIPTLDQGFKEWALSGGYRAPSVLTVQGMGPKLLRHFSFGNIPYVSRRVCPFCGEDALPEERSFEYDELAEQAEQEREEARARGEEVPEVEDPAKDKNYFRCTNCGKVDIGRVTIDQIQASVNMAALIYLELAASRETERSTGEGAVDKVRPAFIRGLGIGVPMLISQSGKSRMNEEQETEIGTELWNRLLRREPLDFGDRRLTEGEQKFVAAWEQMRQRGDLSSGQLNGIWTRAMSMIMPRTQLRDQSHGRRFLMIKIGNSILPRVMGVRKRGSRVEMGVFGQAGIPPQIFQNGFPMGDILEDNARFISPISEHVGTKKYGPGSITDIPYPGLVTNPQDIRGHMIEQLTPRMLEKTQNDPEYGDFDVEVSPGRLNREEGQARSRMQNNVIKQRLQRTGDYSRDVVAAAMSLVDDVGDFLLENMGLDPEQVDMTERVQHLEQVIRNWAFRIIQQFGLQAPEDIEETANLIVQTMHNLERVADENTDTLGVVPAYEENHDARNAAVTWLFWTIHDAGIMDESIDDILQQIIPAAIDAVPIVNYAESVGKDPDEANMTQRWFKDLVEEAQNMLLGQTYKLRRLRHIMKEGSGGEGGRLALRDEAKLEVAERISAILAATVVSRPENIQWNPTPDRVNKEGEREPATETNYPPIEEGGRPVIDPQTGYLARDFEQEPQLVQKYDMSTPKKKVTKDITLKGGMFGKPNVIEKVVETQAGEEMEKFYFLRDIFWLASGAFGFGGDWSQSSRLKAELRQEERADIDETVEFPHGAMFTPDEIAKRYGVDPEVVQRMLQDTEAFVREFYLSNAGEDEGSRLTATLLTMIFFLPQKLLTLFADTAAKREDTRTKRGRQSPVGRAAKFVFQIGKLVESVLDNRGRPDPNDPDMINRFVTFIFNDPQARKLLAHYQEELGDNETFLAVIRDILISGPTKRAYDVISRDPNLVEELLKKLTPRDMAGDEEISGDLGEVTVAIRTLSKMARTAGIHPDARREAWDLAQSLIEELVWQDVLSM